MADWKNNVIPQGDIADALERVVSALDPTDTTKVDGYQLPQKRMAYVLDLLADKIEAEGGLYAKVPLHICTSAEYDHETLKPKIKNPDKDTFYLVPDDLSEDDMFIEWIYTGRRWEKFGTGGAAASYLSALSDVRLNDVTDGQTLVYNAELGKWVNDTFEVDCSDPGDFE